jgi:hypothetical protein
MNQVKEITYRTITKTTESVGWFEFTKDIIIPCVSIIATVFIGFIISFALKKREEKTKIKQLLIDNYMDYLTARTKDVVYETEAMIYEVLNEILIKRADYLVNSNWHFSFDIIQKAAEESKAKAKEYENNENNWSYFTYRFTFLIGEKKYFKDALPLEKIIETNMLQRDSRKIFKQSIIGEIKQNDEILNNLNTSDKFKIELGVHQIVEMIVYNYNDYQFKYFNPYNIKIAKLISDM